MPDRKKTKIVATLGPATSKKEVIREMIEAGVDVFRINFSHADYDDVKERITGCGKKPCARNKAISPNPGKSIRWKHPPPFNAACMGKLAWKLSA